MSADSGSLPAAAARLVAVVDARVFVREALASVLRQAGLEVVAVPATDALPGALDGRPCAAVVVGPGLPPPVLDAATLVVVLHEGEESPPTSGVPCDVRRVGLDGLVAALVTGDPGSLVGAATGPVAASGTPQLTPRELEVLRAIAEGASSRRTAELLGIQPKTVDNHKESIFTKLGAQSQAQAVALARATGLLSGVAGG